MKVAIGFYGITRSLKYTINSIHENILDILKLHNINYDIYIHTYHLTNYKNIRTGEVINDCDIDNEEYKLLNADYVEIDNQEAIKKKLNLLSYRSHDDPWKTMYNSVDNFILGQYSKLRLSRMIEKNESKYDYILFMRPDCLYMNKLPVDSLELVKDNSIIIPDFQTTYHTSFNDRFSICNVKTYKIYGEVFNSLLDISKKQPLHSETILGQIIDNHQINIIRIPFIFSRVRFNGESVDKF